MKDVLINNLKSSIVLMTEEKQKKLLEWLFEERMKIIKNLEHRSANDTIESIAVLLEDISDTIYGDINKRMSSYFLTCKERPVDINTEVFEFMLAEGWSRLDEALLRVVLGYIYQAELYLSQPTDDIDHGKHMVAFGMSIIDSVAQSFLEKTQIVPVTAAMLVDEKIVEVKSQGTLKAREAKQAASRADRATAIQMYEALKKENPRISKDKAALQLIKCKELSHICSVRTIRSYLPKG